MKCIALALILTLWVRALLPDVAMASPVEPPSPHTLLICTRDGVKEVALDPGELDRGPSHEHAPQVQHCCSCGLLCGGCVLSCRDRIGLPVIYGHSAALGLPAEAVAPITERAPPAHRSRAPPVSS